MPEVITIHCTVCGDSDDPLIPSDDVTFVFHAECMDNCVVCDHLVPVTADGPVEYTDYGIAHKACCMTCDRCVQVLPVDQFNCAEEMQVCIDCVNEAITDDRKF